MNLLFDLDGTLTDSAPGIIRCMIYALERLQPELPTEAELARQIGPPLRETFISLLGAADGALVDEAVRLFRERYSTVGLYENAVYDGVPATLARLAGHRLFVATSKAKPYAERILRHFDLTVHFEAIYGSHLTGGLAHKTELVAHIIDEQRIDPATTAMVGDTKYDILAGRACGLTTIGVTWGYGDDLSRAGADHVVETPSALPKVIEGLVPSVV